MKSTLHVELAVGLAPRALPGSTIPRGSGRGWRPFLADRVEQQLRGRRRPVGADRAGDVGRSCAGLGGSARF
jgi:hypothetical protein